MIDERVLEHHRATARVAEILDGAQLDAYSIGRIIAHRPPGILDLLMVSHVVGHLGILLHAGAISQADDGKTVTYAGARQ